ncbi:VOC family protein [Micromonospora sp. BRA006-A]|nr:VOC family protein [Micromonospora sp. BRA006-A]
MAPGRVGRPGRGGRAHRRRAGGGTLVSDAEAPSFWVLADPDGNRVCLCTWQQRA